MKAAARIALALLLALVFAAPALGADLQSTDKVDQAVYRGAATAAPRTAENPRSHAASERLVGCPSIVLVHNTNGCGSFDDFAAAGDDIPGFKQPGRPGGMSGAQRDFNAMIVGDEVWDYSKTGMPFIRGIDSTGSTIVWRPWSSGNVPTIQNTTTGGKIRYP